MTIVFGFCDFGVDFWECMQKSEAAAMETSRASVVAMNAEIRRAKARMMEEVPKLQKLALKKVKLNLKILTLWVMNLISIARISMVQHNP